MSVIAINVTKPEPLIPSQYFASFLLGDDGRHQNTFFILRGSLTFFILRGSLTFSRAEGCTTAFERLDVINYFTPHYVPMFVFIVDVDY